MNKDDTFEALKGNVKMLDLDSAIERLRSKAIAYTDQFRTEEEKIKFKAQDRIGFDWYVDSIPAGQKRAYNQQVKYYSSQISRLRQTKRQILDLTYSSHDDDDYMWDYSVEITVRRVRLEVEE